MTLKELFGGVNYPFSSHNIESEALDGTETSPIEQKGALRTITLNKIVILIGNTLLSFIKGIKTDTITEYTTNNGVNLNGVTIKNKSVIRNVQGTVSGAFIANVDTGNVLLVDTTGGVATPTLLAANSLPKGFIITFIDFWGNAGTNAITITTHAGDFIGGNAVTTNVIDTNYGFATFMTDGTSRWARIG